MAELDDLGAVWAAATEAIASAQYRAYLRLTWLRAIVEDTALVAVPNEWLSRPDLPCFVRCATCSDITGKRAG